MRSFGLRLPVFVAILWAGIASSVWALGHDRDTLETVYVRPSAITMAVPTSYVVSSSWVEPTAYVVPSYSATAYWADPVVVAQPSYVSTAYLRTGLLGRRWLVERPVLASYATTYIPTSYYVPSTYRARSYLPTVLDYPVVSPSAYVTSLECVCPELVASAAPTRSSGVSRPSTSAGSRSVQSEPTDGSAMPSDVGPPPGGTASGAETATARPAPPEPAPPNPQTPGAGIRDNTPPPPPAAVEKPPANLPQSGQAGQGSAQTGTPKGASRPPANPNAAGAPAPAGPPKAPDGLNELEPFPPPDNNPTGEIRREARRPADLSRTNRPGTRNVLLGTVKSEAIGEPEEGVRITLTNQSNSTINRVGQTDALGRFAIRLDDGDWTVKVTMSSGRVYIPEGLSQIRVRNGQVTDLQGRRVPSLEITR